MIEVVAGLIIKENQVFCTQRKNKGPLALKWEFPGGKIEAGETHSEALVRELKEELEIDVVVKKYYMTITHKYPSFELVMHVYKFEGDLSVYKLNEHEAALWIDIDDLMSLDWAEADIPIVEKIIAEESH